MSKATTKTLVPKLRFPEFRGAGAWREIRLEDFDGLVHGDGDWILSKDISINGQYKIVQLGNIGLGDFIDKPMKTISAETYKELGGTRITEGDLLINRMVDSNLYCCLFMNNGNYITSVDVCWIRNNPYFNNYFLMNLILHAPNQQKLLNLSSGSGRVRISKKNLFEKFNFFMPNLKEQQKIADCLSSIDELITAHTQKHEALKAHKKGLMQQLFPAEGETVPKLRFPEFQDAGEWEEKPLFKVCEINPTVDGLPNKFIYIDLESVVSGSLLFKKEITKNDAPSRAQRLLKNGDVIYQMVRPYQKNNLLCDFTDGNKYVASTGYAQLRSFDSSNFLYQAVHTGAFVDEVLAKSTGSNYPAINSKDLAKIDVIIPKPPEQQKIADLLSSIDKLITAQSKKIDALKAHKKGLMQQLFPATNEVDG